MSKTRPLKDKILDRIESCIVGIYRNKRIELVITEDIRNNFKIPADLYSKNIAKFTDEVCLDDLLQQLYNYWADTIPEKGKEIQEICDNMSPIFSKYSTYKKDVEKINKKYSSRKCYVLYYLKQVISGKSIVYYLMRRNPVWKKVISARVLTIPLDVVIKHRESILDDYLPKINDDLTIKIHEMTDVRDFKYIKHEIDVAQKAYRKKYKLQINPAKNILYSRNLRAYELRRIEKKSYKDSRLILEEEFKELVSEKFDDSDINKMVKSHLKYADDVWYP